MFKILKTLRGKQNTKTVFVLKRTSSYNAIL